MKIIKIQDVTSQTFKKCFEIYEESFPIYERRNLEIQLLAQKHDDYHFEAILNDEDSILGLLLTWQTSDFVFVEHIAILESARGQNIGSKVLEKLKEKSSKAIILEIEPPIDDISCRRKAFYTRLGFEETPYAYMHPGYTKDSIAHELQILSFPKIDDALYNTFHSYLRKTIMFYSEKKDCEFIKCY